MRIFAANGSVRAHNTPDRNLDLPEPNSCLVLKKSGLKEQQQEESEAGLLVTTKM